MDVGAWVVLCEDLVSRETFMRGWWLVWACVQYRRRSVEFSPMAGGESALPKPRVLSSGPWQSKVRLC